MKRKPYELALWAALPMARTSRIEGRLTMILDTTRPRRALTRRALLLVLGLGAAALVPLAMLQPVARAQSALLRPRESERNDPVAALRHLQQIYTYISIYRRTHSGSLPATLGPNSLAADMASHPQAYGLPDQGVGNKAQAIRCFTSPGSLTTVYFLHNKRPDGTLVGTSKPTGMRDVFADTNLFVHNHPQGASGFYLVLWDDGTAGKVPAGEILTVPAYDVIGPAGATEQARRQGEKQIAFPGQAGLPRG